MYQKIPCGWKYEKKKKINKTVWSLTNVVLLTSLFLGYSLYQDCVKLNIGPALAHPLHSSRFKKKKSKHCQPAGTEQSAAAVQPAYINKATDSPQPDQQETCRHTSPSNKTDLNWRIGFIIPSSVKGRLPLTRTTDVTGDDQRQGQKTDDVWDEGGLERGGRLLRAESMSGQSISHNHGI